MADFPKPEALAAIAAEPAPPPQLDDGVVPDEGWTVDLAPADGEAPGAVTADAPWQPRSGWDRAFAQALDHAGRSPKLTEAMACVARELARWAVDHDKTPPESLRRFILGACGALAPTVAMRSMGGTAPADVDDDTVLQEWGGKVGSDLVAGLPVGATDAGFAFIRSGANARAVLVYATRHATIDPFSLAPSATGTVELTGDLGEPTDAVGGHVNQGRYGVVPCAVDPSVPRPRFRLTCPVKSDDESAWIELVYAQPRRVLMTTFARVLARRPGASMHYQAAATAGGTTATSADQFAQAAVTALNQERAHAGLGAVRLSAAQSAAAARVAPHYFGATLGGTGAWLDTIALGLLAGWQIDGMIRDGSFISTLVPGTHDPARWLAETLEMPGGRMTLLAPEIDEVALGPWLLDAPQAAGALVTGFRLYRGNDHAADVARLETRILQARTQRFLAAPKRFGLERVMEAELEKVRLGKSEPRQALQRVLDATSPRPGVTVRGYVVETTSLDALEIPEGVLAQPTLVLEVGVTHHKPPGAAWAQLVIFVVYQDLAHIVPT